MIIKNFLLILWICVGLTSCGNNKNGDIQSSAKDTPKDIVEVVYFHGKQRCITCNAIEKLTKEVVEMEFAQQLKENKITFKIVDISTKEGEKIADRYEVTWSSLYINKWKDGMEAKNNMTEFGFSYAKGSPELFKIGVKRKIDELLK